MKYSEFVLGNSSSGILETPSFHVATVNIGNRQRGRLQAESIINCGTKSEEIKKAIEIALTPEHREKCMAVKSPYGEGGTAEKIAMKAYEVVMDGSIDLKKSFYDL